MNQMSLCVGEGGVQTAPTCHPSRKCVANFLIWPAHYRSGVFLQSTLPFQSFSNRETPTDQHINGVAGTVVEGS
jgi:hypothetical protein